MKKRSAAKVEEDGLAVEQTEVCVESIEYAGNITFSRSSCSTLIFVVVSVKVWLGFDMFN